MLNETFYSDTAHNSKHDEVNTKALFTGSQCYPGLYDGPSLWYNESIEIKGLSCNGSNRDIWFCFCWIFKTWRKQGLFIPFQYLFHILFCFLSLLWCLCTALPCFELQPSQQWMRESITRHAILSFHADDSNRKTRSEQDATWRHSSAWHTVLLSWPTSPSFHIAHTCS